jgi:hypothetical protein
MRCCCQRLATAGWRASKAPDPGTRSCRGSASSTVPMAIDAAFLAAGQAKLLPFAQRHTTTFRHHPAAGWRQCDRFYGLINLAKALTAREHASSRTGIPVLIGCTTTASWRCSAGNHHGLAIIYAVMNGK